VFKGFKDFLLRGNVLDLAVAVVVGAAFTAIVTSFTQNVINPLVAVAGGGNELGWGYQLLADNPATFVNLGAVVTAVINFVIIAAVVYFILIVPANAAKKRFVTEPGDKKASEADLLIQIRDLLETRLDTKGTPAVTINPRSPLS
jgi:large conductance mechanosensitive channel